MASEVSGIAVLQQPAPSYFSCCDTVRAMGGRIISCLDPSPLVHALKALVQRIQELISECFSYWMTPKVSEEVPARPLQSRPLSVISCPQTPPAEAVSRPACSHCKIRHISEDAALLKMVKNAQKSLAEHKRKAPWDGNAFATTAQATVSVEALKAPVTLPPVQVVGAFAGNIGPSRPTMQDAHCLVDLGTGTLAMVCDGHGPDENGDEVARYTVQEFQARFPAALQAAGGNVHRAFEELIHAIHVEVMNKPEWNWVGSTAVISYIDKASHRIYTATLGDSEATLYRNFGTEMKAIPLSPVRDWSCPKDAARAANSCGQPDIARLWPLRSPKELRMFGLNVSRAIGDNHATGCPEAPAVIHKLKITVFQAKPGDKLVLACDGLRDYAAFDRYIFGIPVDHQNPETQIVREVKKNQSVQALANGLVGLGLKGMTEYAGDNITVVAVNIL